MSRATELFQTQLSDLPVPERAELAKLLLQSLDDCEDADADTAWDAEIQRRVEEIRSGSVMGRTAEEVLAELRKPKL